MDEKEVKRLLGNYSYNRARIAELQEKLNSICIKITTTYGNLAPSSGGAFTSKVENVGNRRYNLRQQISHYRRENDKVSRMIERSGLSELEKQLMWWIANNGKLAAYARRERIGKDNVYKIRDRAIRKIIAAHKPQNER